MARKKLQETNTVLVDVREMGRKRWEGVSDEERTALMSAAARSRWDSMTEAERKAEGARLAEARAVARKKKKKKG
jgi:predicted Fe-S protein YdhL (DUF1289 family)